MFDHTRLKQRAGGLFLTAEGLTSGTGQKPLLQRLHEARGRLEAGQLHAVVCGEWRRGKSTLINMLLEEEELCPTGKDVTTAVVTVIQHGESARFTILVGEPGKEESKPITREQVAEYVSEKHNPGNVKQARLLLIELPNPRLRDGLVFVDTPGVGGALARHTDITYAYIPKADAVLFVTDPTPLTVPEIEFVKLVDRHCKSVLFVVTKMEGDAGVKADPVIAGNREKLAEALKVPAATVPMIPVSSMTKGDYLANGDEQDLEDSGFPELERELWQLLGMNRGRVMLASALLKLDRVLADLREVQAAELAAILEQDQQKRAAIKADYETAARRFGELQGNNAGWRDQLSDGLAAVRRVTDQALTAGFKEVHRQNNRYLNNDAYLQAPEQIPAMLETDVDALLAEIQDLIERESGDLYVQLEKATGLGLARAPVAEIAITAPQLSFDMSSIEKLGTMGRTLTYGREMAFNAAGGGAIFGMIGAFVGGLAGGLIGGLIGLVGGPAGAVAGAIGGAKVGAGAVGGLAGMGGMVAGKAYALRNSARKVRDADKQAVHTTLAPELRYFIEDCEAAVRGAIDDVLAGLTKAMKDDMNARLQGEETRLKDVLERFRQAESRSAEENATRIPSIRETITQIDATRREVALLAEEIVRSAPMPSNLPPSESP